MGSGQVADVVLHFWGRVSKPHLPTRSLAVSVAGEAHALPHLSELTLSTSHTLCSDIIIFLSQS